MTCVYDPSDPVPSVGGTITSGEPLKLGGAFDQREGPEVFGARPPYRALSERPDVLSFQTLPPNGEVKITGAIVVTL
jgi:hypothetical protein